MKGLYNKYHIEKTDGSLVDPTADYFVLRLDSGEYVDACRAAAATFFEWIAIDNPQLSAEGLANLAAYVSANCPYCGGPITEGDGEESPPLYCDPCSRAWPNPEALQATEQALRYAER